MPSPNTKLATLSLLLALVAARPASAAVKAVIIYGNESESGLRPYWLDNIRFSYEYLAQRLKPENVFVYFNGSDQDLATAGLQHAAHVAKNPKTKDAVAAVVALADANDVVLMIYGHGWPGSGAIDMLGSGIKADADRPPFQPMDVVKAKNAAHALAVVHVACYGGLAYAPHKLVAGKGAAPIPEAIHDVDVAMRAKNAVAFTFATTTPANGTIALEMTKWILPRIFCEELTQGIYKQSMQDFAQKFGSGGSAELARRKRDTTLGQAADRFIEECGKSYRGSGRSCGVYPIASSSLHFSKADARLSQLLPQYRCGI